ncbi:hypothetical protein B0H13DRAFT_2312160 [Mycena leptocephala]|nr:hypothetical protein B0H13DRAFT_2312160 [Mycena leptocephala]
MLDVRPIAIAISTALTGTLSFPRCHVIPKTASLSSAYSTLTRHKTTMPAPADIDASAFIARPKPSPSPPSPSLAKKTVLVYGHFDVQPAVKSDGPVQWL